jgi:hydrogenase expression/formation protein HypE
MPESDYPHVLLAHGSGGMLMHQLIDKIFIPAFGDAESPPLHDGAVVKSRSGRLAVTTDSYVVHPLFFPGGDIGKLAVCGTVNDLAMCGARPMYLTAAFILEEGLPMETLRAIVESMRSAAEKSDIRIITGDTKVVDRGNCDSMFINTTGIGIVDHKLTIGPGVVRPKDAVLLNGDIGRHGIAVMAKRDGLSFETEIESDCAPLDRSVSALIESGIDVHCLRDLTRGGLATALVEIARDSNAHVQVREKDIAVREDVRGACELLGLDPMYVANEGRFVAFIPEDQSQQALEIMRSDPIGQHARIIGGVSESERGLVTLKTVIGTERIVEMLSGEQLPRIC